MIGADLQLLLRRRRVWLCWALLCALPALVAVLLAATGLAPPPGRGGAFLSAVVALALVLPVFLPITVKAWTAGWVTTGALTAGTALDATHLMQAEVDMADGPGNAILDRDAAVGRILSRPLAAGSALRKNEPSSPRNIFGRSFLLWIAPVNPKSELTNSAGLRRCPGVSG